MSCFGTATEVTAKAALLENAQKKTITNNLVKDLKFRSSIFYHSNGRNKSTVVLLTIRPKSYRNIDLYY